MMKKLIALVFATLFASLALAQEAPDVLVKQVTEEVLDIVRKDKSIQNGDAKKAIDLVDAKVIPHFNFQHMTALAVGKDWRKASPQQQQQLAAEFKTLLVRTEVQQPGNKPVQLDYSLEKLDAGWKVYDVNVAGISLVTNYREQFGQEIRNGGIDGLIKAIATKNKSLEGNLAKADGK